MPTSWLLAADLVASTALVVRYRGRADALIDSWRAWAEGAVLSSGGTILSARSEGDGLVAVFPEAAGAIATAVLLAKGGDEPGVAGALSARVGLHRCPEGPARGTVLPRPREVASVRQLADAAPAGAIVVSSQFLDGVRAQPIAAPPSLLSLGPGCPPVWVDDVPVSLGLAFGSREPHPDAELDPVAHELLATLQASPPGLGVQAAIQRLGLDLDVGFDLLDQLRAARLVREVDIDVYEPLAPPTEEGDIPR